MCNYGPQFILKLKYLIEKYISFLEHFSNGFQIMSHLVSIIPGAASDTALICLNIKNLKFSINVPSFRACEQKKDKFLISQDEN